MGARRRTVPQIYQHKGVAAFDYLAERVTAFRQLPHNDHLGEAWLKSHEMEIILMAKDVQRGATAMLKREAARDRTSGDA